MAINLERPVQCPHCNAKFRIDYEEFCDDISTYERQMGAETVYSFNVEDYICPKCGKKLSINGSISEYPEGAYNFEEIKVSPGKEEED